MPWRWLQAGLVALLAALTTSIACAHEVRPAYLQIDEIGPSRYQLFWRTPVISGMRLPVTVQSGRNSRSYGTCSPRTLRFFGQHRLIHTGTEGLDGKRIEFVGLQATITDVLVRVQMLTARIQPR